MEVFSLQAVFSGSGDSIPGGGDAYMVKLGMLTAAGAAALLLGAFSGASARAAIQEYPHAFPRAGVTKLIDNPRVTVWEVNWIHGARQPIHRHRYDMAGVYLRFGEITVTRPDGTATTGQKFDVPRPYFQVKGITHREEALGKPGEPERLAIMVDLKEVTVEPFTIPAGGTAAFHGENAKNVLENDRVRMWDHTWATTMPKGGHVHLHDSVEVYVTGGTIRTRDGRGAETTREVAFKQARWVPRGTAHSELAVGPSPRAIVIELK